MKGDLVRGQVSNLILAILAQGPCHGYAVMRSLCDQSDGVIDMPEGSIYPALYRLERQGFIRSEKTRHEGRDRRLYHLTARGQAELTKARADWRSFSAAVEAILAPHLGGTAYARGTRQHQ